MISPMTMQTPGVPQGLPQGHGAGYDQTCPMCGRPLPLPYNQGSSPQVQMPQDMMPPMMSPGGDMNSALLMALMGGAGGGMG